MIPPTPALRGDIEIVAIHCNDSFQAEKPPSWVGADDVRGVVIGCNHFRRRLLLRNSMASKWMYVQHRQEVIGDRVRRVRTDERPGGIGRKEGVIGVCIQFR
jgi:hypothetical protein